ncbi:MAG: alpha/beta hydrolase [Dehalococcoidales bacterium]
MQSDSAPGNLVRFSVDEVILEGNLSLPPRASGVVLFAHGSGSSRFSKRNQYVADVLWGVGLATFLFDLLTAEEAALDEKMMLLRFDIPLLAKRLVGATDWIREQKGIGGRPLGYFGASTGAAAALVAAVERPQDIAAVVSRGGRPDLAEGALPRVRAATLLIVGGDDYQVIEFNRAASEKMNTTREMVIVPGATHLFPEPGALEEVSRLATDWFRRHLVTEPS